MIEERLKNLGYEVQRVFGGGYIITAPSGIKMQVTDEVFLSVGMPRRKYFHEPFCSYHKDNLDENSWRLPNPPTCKCLFEELEPYTEQDVINFIRRGLIPPSDRKQPYTPAQEIQILERIMDTHGKDKFVLQRIKELKKRLSPQESR